MLKGNVWQNVFNDSPLDNDLCVYNIELGNNTVYIGGWGYYDKIFRGDNANSTPVWTSFGSSNYAGDQKLSVDNKLWITTFGINSLAYFTLHQELLLFIIQTLCR
jgi:hypothetical protein